VLICASRPLRVRIVTAVESTSPITHICQPYSSSGIMPAVVTDEKSLVWIGSSKKDLMALPAGVRRFFGHALHFAQRGDRHDAAKVMKGFGGAGVLEVVEDDAGGTYRAVYTVKFEETVFVLHCFQKKSRQGIATPKVDMDIIRARLKIAELLAKEARDGKTNR
jgi:phage-related protein